MRWLFLALALFLTTPVWAVFPTVESVTPFNNATAATTHNVTMPATVNSGDLLILMFNTAFNPTHTTPTGWTLEWSATGTSADRTSVYVKDAVGDEGGTTVAVVISASREASAHTYRITGWEGTLAGGVESGTAATGNSTIPDPPSLTPTWGALDTLWIAHGGSGNDDAALSSSPTNYTNGLGTVCGGGADKGCDLYSARRELNATSDDPGTFALGSSEGWAVNLIAVRPAAVGGVRPTIIIRVD